MALLSGERLLQRLRAGERFVADGAMGTQLMEQGIAPADTLAANLTHPISVLEIHRRYLVAGAQILTANTFGAGIGCNWERAFVAGIQLAYEAATACESETAVCISLSAQAALQHGPFLPAIMQKIDCWSGLLLVETCVSLEQARNAAALSTLFGGTALAVSCHFGVDARMPDGTGPDVAAIAIQRAGAALMGANCGSAPDLFPEIASAMAAAIEQPEDTPLLFRPSAGLPQQDAQGRWKYPIPSETFAGIAARLFEAGANIVGGCCGTTPDHIRSIPSPKSHRTSD